MGEAVSYAALVERIPAGAEGNEGARQLVRAVVGPLPLNALAVQRKLTHLAAVRVPETADVSRLASVAWIEDATGRMIVATESGCPSNFGPTAPR